MIGQFVPDPRRNRLSIPTAGGRSERYWSTDVLGDRLKQKEDILK
jgi:hypothetical protein